jgi:hypothetical protein
MLSAEDSVVYYSANIPRKRYWQVSGVFLVFILKKIFCKEGI